MEERFCYIGWKMSEFSLPLMMISALWLHKKMKMRWINFFLLSSNDFFLNLVYVSADESWNFSLKIDFNIETLIGPIIFDESIRTWSKAIIIIIVALEKSSLIRSLCEFHQPYVCTFKKAHKLNWCIKFFKPSRAPQLTPPSRHNGD